MRPRGAMSSPRQGEGEYQKIDTIVSMVFEDPLVEQGAGASSAPVPPGDPRDLIRSSSFCALVHAVNQLGHAIAPELTRAGLTPTQYFVLGQVVLAPASTPAELARACAMLPQSMGVLLDTAERRGWVARDGVRGRGRTTRVTITTEGLRLLAAGWPVVQTVSDRLAPAQRSTLLALLDQLTAAGVGDDVVVLVDADGRDAGTRPRAEVHTTNTPLHRAFSTYLRRSDGQVLVTRRALAKKTWPGVWTNAACGHSRPGETALDAALRRVPDELGTAPLNLRMALPDFRYRAVDASGIVEHELCPVLVGEIDADALAPDPREVAEHAWLPWSDLRTLARTGSFLLSPWSVAQIEQLGEQPW